MELVIGKNMWVLEIRKKKTHRRNYQGLGQKVRKQLQISTFLFDSKPVHERGADEPGNTTNPW